ncbi:MAG TPA: polyprenol monophosphomannose synthase, partial [Anaerolineae bacterium]
PGMHIIVVDDNSPDGTGRIADEFARTDGLVHPLHRPAKLGLGTAHIAGIELALGAGHDKILTMDADFSHSPKYIPALVAGLDTFDLMIGSRYVPGGGTRYCPLKRRVLSRGANMFAKMVLGLRAGDCTAGFRAYRRAVLESIELKGIFSNGYSFLIEILFKCQQAGWHIGETPIIFEDRRHGSSKISRNEVIRALQTVTRLKRENGRLPGSITSNAARKK